MYKDEEEKVKALQNYANNIITNCTTPVNSIISVILNKTSISENNSQLNLSMDDLYTMAIRIPAECAFLQAQINGQLIEQKIKSFITETRITESMVLLQGQKGDAKERQRRAEAMSKEDMLVDITTQTIITALQATVQRADKVYEGIKKIIDAKSKEMTIDMKPGQSVTRP